MGTLSPYLTFQTAQYAKIWQNLANTKKTDVLEHFTQKRYYLPTLTNNTVTHELPIMEGGGRDFSISVHHDLLTIQFQGKSDVPAQRYRIHRLHSVQIGSLAPFPVHLPPDYPPHPDD